MLEGALYNVPDALGQILADQLEVRCFGEAGKQANKMPGTGLGGDSCPGLFFLQP
ncbi:hypothetical protein D3C80_1400700 [compost metagenome]